MAGKRAAWSRGSTALIAISTQCNSATNCSNIDAVTTRECYYNDGNDMVIWTYHFTSFAAYTPAVTNATNATAAATGSTSTSVPYNIGEISEATSVERTAKNTDTISFEVAGTAYTATVGAVTSDSAVITLLGEATTLPIDGYERYDLDDDGIYDLEISLESITGQTTKYAKFKFKKISIAAEVAPEEEAPAEEAPEEEAPAEAGVAGLLTEIAKISPTWLLTISIVVVIAVIIIFLIVPRLMKKKY